MSPIGLGTDAGRGHICCSDLGPCTHARNMCSTRPQIPATLTILVHNGCDVRPRAHTRIARDVHNASRAAVRCAVQVPARRRVDVRRFDDLRGGDAPVRHRDLRGQPAAISAPGLGSPRPHLHRDRALRDRALPCHICAGSGLTPCHICAGTGLTPCHICAGTGLTPATSAPGLGSPLPHLHRDWAHSAPRPQLQLPRLAE